MPRFTKRYHGPAYIIGMDTRGGASSLLRELQQVARNAAIADEKAGVITTGPKSKHTVGALRSALDEMKGAI